MMKAQRLLVSAALWIWFGLGCAIDFTSTASGIGWGAVFVGLAIQRGAYTLRGDS